MPPLSSINMAAVKIYQIYKVNIIKNTHTDNYKWAWYYNEVNTFFNTVHSCSINYTEFRNWLSMVLRLCQHNIGYTADGFYRSDDPTNSVKALKEGG